MRSCHYIVALHLIGTEQGTGAQIGEVPRLGGATAAKLRKKPRVQGRGGREVWGREASKHQENLKT